jgi:hypothetical protein
MLYSLASALKGRTVSAYKGRGGRGKMRRFICAFASVLALAGVFVSAGFAADPSPPFSQCPAVGADSSCALLIRIAPTGQAGVYGDPSQAPFDGVEDTLIGVQNDSSSSIASIPVSSSTGKDLFGFDGDGVCTFITCTWAAPTSYEGPGVSFTNISADLTSGTVVFSPAIPPGGQTYFSLEEALATVPPFDINPGPPASAKSYVALGDSYSAGEGLHPYRAGSDTSSDECHRSNDAYGPLLDSDRNLGALTFVACSGAVTAWLASPNPKNNEPAQFNSLNSATTTVTLTIGGNDAGFAQVLTSCVFGRLSIFKVFGHAGCSNDKSLNNTVKARLNALDGLVNTASPDGTDLKSLSAVLLAAHQKAPNAKIYLAGYPQLFGYFTHECGVGDLNPQGGVLIPDGFQQAGAAKITGYDAAWINGLAVQLNGVIKRAVTRAVAQGVPATFVDVDSFFHGHRLCDTGKSWISPLLGIQDDNSGKIVGRGSFHPTKEGQKAYEAAFIAAGIGS